MHFDGNGDEWYVECGEKWRLNGLNYALGLVFFLRRYKFTFISIFVVSFWGEIIFGVLKLGGGENGVFMSLVSSV